MMHVFAANGLVAQDMWDPSAATRVQTCVSCIGRQVLNHWATREVPRIHIS